MLSAAKRIEERILDDIRSGKYPVNSPVPSRNRLAELYGCSRTTVERAVNELSGLGFLRSRKGSGTYVRKQTPDTGETREVDLIATWNILEEYLLSKGLNSEEEAFGIPCRRYRYEEMTLKFDTIAQKGHAVIWVMPKTDQLDHMEHLRKKGIPQLLINRKYRSFDFIATDAEAGLREGLAWLLIEAGRDIALVAQKETVDTPFSAERQLAFYRTSAFLGARLHEEFLFSIPAESRLEEVTELGRALFLPERRPKGICVLDQIYALPLVVCAKSFGLEPGRDFHLLTFDRLPELAHIPGIACLMQDFAGFNEETVRWVNLHRNGETGEPFRVERKPVFFGPDAD